LEKLIYCNYNIHIYPLPLDGGGQGWGEYWSKIFSLYHRNGDTYYIVKVLVLNYLKILIYKFEEDFINWNKEKIRHLQIKHGIFLPL
jgi:hypothetical protein